MMLSIRLLNISLVLGCIVVTAVLCLTLAVTSSEDALDKTKQSRDTSVKDAFAVGEASVLQAVDENMNTLGNEALEFLSSFFTQHRLTSQAAMGIFQRPAPGDLEPSWDTIYGHRTTMWNLMHANNKAGLGVIGITTHDYKVLGITEYTDTLLRGPDEYHHLFYLLSNGTAYDHQAWLNGVQGVPAKNRLIAASAVPESGDAFSFPDDVGNVLAGCVTGFPQAIATNGSVLDRACSLDTLPFADAHGGAYNFPSAIQGPEGMRWSSPVNIGASGYSVMYIYGIFGHSARAKVGQVYGGVDVRAIKRFFKNIKIGVRSDGGESYGRLFTVVRDYWLTPGSTSSDLIAVSHGESTVNSNGLAVPLAPVNATDPVISETASAIETKLGGYDAVMNATVLQNYTIATNRMPDGEGFYVKVRRFYDTTGIDWYVVIIVDREYILGEIVRNTMMTQQAIDASEKQVDDDQKKAQVVMYVTVVSCAVVMIVLCVVLVLRITAPLLQLEGEMALVAVMDLEGVNLKEKSSLSEVRGMQESFAVMIRNLCEYREYMPASVLVDPKDTESEDSVAISATRSARSENGGTQVTSSRMSSGGTLEKPIHAAVKIADLRMKKVSLGVLSMKGWLSKPDPVNTHKMYLEVVLSEATARRTIVDEFNGDRVYISGNGARQLNGHSIEMGRVLLTVSRRCEGMGIKVSGVATAGKAQCGNIGCQGLKKYSFVGPLSSWLHMMGLISGRYEEAPVVVDDVLKRDLGTSFLLKIVDRVMYEKLHQHGILLHHLVAESEGVAENEWMYQLEEGDRSNPFRSHDAVMEAALKTNYDEAVGLLDGVRDGPHRELLSKDIAKRRAGGTDRYLLHLDNL